jgi:hypothetical protein
MVVFDPLSRIAVNSKKQPNVVQELFILYIQCPFYSKTLLILMLFHAAIKRIPTTFLPHQQIINISNFLIVAVILSILVLNH